MLLTISEAAKLLNVCENTLRDWDENGKFRAVRTEGGHRRYSLEQIRNYLEENQEVEDVDETIVEDNALVYKWGEYLNDVPKDEAHVLAQLLENADNYHVEGGCSKANYFKLTKDSWLKCRFKKMVNIQPMTKPADLVFYLDNNKVVDGVVAARSYSFNFKFFNDRFEDFMDVYSDTIARELEFAIVKLLPEVSFDALQNAIKKDRKFINDLDYDYIIGPKNFIEELSKIKKSGMDFYDIAVFLGEDTLLPSVFAGKYPKKFSVPIFCPYLLFCIAPATVTNVRGCFSRFGVFNGEKE